METCYECDQIFDEGEGINSSSGEFYCNDCWGRNDLSECPECNQFVDGLESDGLCESCSPDDYWKEPDFMDSHDPD
jgi:hypothetical protein